MTLPGQEINARYEACRLPPDCWRYRGDLSPASSSVLPLSLWERSHIIPEAAVNANDTPISPYVWAAIPSGECYDQ